MIDSLWTETFTRNSMGPCSDNDSLNVHQAPHSSFLAVSPVSAYKPAGGKWVTRALPAKPRRFVGRVTGLEVAALEHGARRYLARVLLRHGAHLCTVGPRKPTESMHGGKPMGKTKGNKKTEVTWMSSSKAASDWWFPLKLPLLVDPKKQRRKPCGKPWERVTGPHSSDSRGTVTRKGDQFFCG